MKVTFHAAKRFLERVLHKTRYSQADIMSAKQLLEDMFTTQWVYSTLGIIRY